MPSSTAAAPYGVKQPHADSIFIVAVSGPCDPREPTRPIRMHMKYRSSRQKCALSCRLSCRILCAFHSMRIDHMGPVDSAWFVLRSLGVSCDLVRPGEAAALSPLPSFQDVLTLCRRLLGHLGRTLYGRAWRTSRERLDAVKVARAAGRVQVSPAGPLSKPVCLLLSPIS